VSDPGVQTVSDLRIEAPEGYRLTREPEYGNQILYCAVEAPTASTKISWSAIVTRFEDRGQGTLPTGPRYLQRDRLVPVDGKAADMAGQLGATGSGTVDARAKRIYDDVLASMVYDKSGEGWGRGDFEHAVTVCRGNCTDFHSRFVGVGRAAGIPVRFTMGIPMKADPSGEYDSYHCWAHYRDGGRWKPVDISEADKVADKDPGKAEWFFGHLDYNRISLTFGRDIRLEPPQKGDRLNYFVFPHVEADGTELKLGKSSWKFTYENVQ
jgi:transglutaminase-like putative cysteine protease